MIKIVGNDVLRGGEKIGWVEGNDIFDHEGNKVGYVSGHVIYDRGGEKIASVEGEYIKARHQSASIRLAENRQHVSGGALSDELRAAIRVLLGG